MTQERKPKKMKEKTKKEKKVTLVSVKKLPTFFKKKRNAEKLEKDVFKRILITSDKELVTSLYEEIDGFFVISNEKQITKKELALLKKISKDIKKQKAFRIKILPLVIAVGFVVALVFVGILFKDIALKIAVEKTGESIFNAQCTVKQANFSLLNAEIRLLGLEQANKDKPMTNLFSIDLIHIKFDLVELLKKKFVSEQLEVSGIQLGTERKTSGALPIKAKKEKKSKKENDKEKGESFDLGNILALPAIRDEKNDIIASLSSYDPKNILANLNDQLKSPKLAETVQKEVLEVLSKYEGLDKEYLKEFDELSTQVNSLKTIDIEALKKDPSTIPAALSLVQETLDKTKETKTKVDKTSSQISIDVKKMAGYTKEINTAFTSDLAFISKEINTVTSFRLDDVENIFNKELEKIAVRSLGKYYPYAIKGLNFAKEMSINKQKEVKPKKEKALVRKGRLITYKKDIYPSILIKNIHVSSMSSSWNLDARVLDVSNDMDLWGKPASVAFSFDTKGVKNLAQGIVDMRENAAQLVSLVYEGSGLALDFSSINASLNKGIQNTGVSIDGLPLISGTSYIHANAEIQGLDAFTIKGSLVLDPCSVSTARFEPNFVYSVYNRALSKLDTLDADFSVGNTKEKGFDLTISSSINDRFVAIFKEIMNEEFVAIKAEATKEAKKYLQDSLEPVYKVLGEFDSVESLVQNNKKKFEGLQKEAESKLAEIKDASLLKAREEAQKVADKAKEEAQKAADKAKEEAQKAADQAKDAAVDSAQGALKNTIKSFR